MIMPSNYVGLHRGKYDKPLTAVQQNVCHIDNLDGYSILKIYFNMLLEVAL